MLDIRLSRSRRAPVQALTVMAMAGAKSGLVTANPKTTINATTSTQPDSHRHAEGEG